MTDQKLVDELEKALRDEAYDGGFGYMGDEQFRAYVRTLAETAAEVFEKAHTPTDDEREDMIAFLLRDHNFEESPWGRTYTDAEIAAALRRTEVPELSADWYDLSVKAFPWDGSEGDAVLEARRRMVQVLTDNFPEHGEAS
ncbi:hypothetical protein [Microbacterium maritypicum]|uniref:hypothetical protein n=1 Tax=Microbacterium maritypicum TaxID=33918 RepID=UPI003D740E51